MDSGPLCAPCRHRGPRAGPTASDRRRRALENAARRCPEHDRTSLICFEDAVHRTHTLESERSEIERLAQTVALKAQGRLNAAALDLDQIKMQVGKDGSRTVSKAVEDLNDCHSLVESGTISVTDEARKDVEHFVRIIIGMGPQSTLQRGFAIVRDDEDKPLTSREAAITLASFQVEFRDGKLGVKNLESGEQNEK
jgi:exodeoxyribonuclease VII large subunit